MGGTARAEELTMKFGVTATAAPGLSSPKVPLGLTLEALIEEALQKNPQIKVTDTQIGEAKALYQLAASVAYPTISGQFLIGGPSPEAKTEVVNDPSTITAPSLQGDFDFGQLGVAIRASATGVLPLYTFGKIEAGKKAASYVVKASKHQTNATRAQVIVDITRAYWGIQLLRTLLSSLEDGKNVLQKVLNKIEELLENDTAQVTENDRLRLKYALSTLGVRETEAEAAIKIATRALQLLLGRPQTGALKLVDADLVENLPDDPPTIDALLASAQQDRPELRALAAIVEAQRAFSELRRAAFYPDIFFGVGLEYAYTSNATNHTNPFINDDFNFFNLGIGLGMRFQLDVFTKLAQLEQAEAQARVREQQAVLASRAVELEIRKLHAEIDGGYKKIGQLKRAHRSARGWLTASTLAYDIGTGQADELIDAFLALAASEADLQRTRFDTLLKLTEIARASGKLLSRKQRYRPPKSE